MLSTSPRRVLRALVFSFLLLASPFVGMAGASSDPWEQGASRSGTYPIGAAAIDGHLYVVHGPSFEVYDVASDTWATQGDLPAQWGSGIGAWGTRLVAAGGWGGSGSDVWAYDTVASALTQLPSLPGPRERPMVAEIDGTLVVLGGYGCAGFCTDVFAFDEDAGVWAPLAPLPEPALGAAAIPAPGGLYVAFGTGPNGPTGRLLQYSASADVWEELPPAPSARDGVTAGACGGKIYAHGGLGVPSDAILVYDPAAATWSAGPHLPTPVGGVVGVTSAGGSFVVLDAYSGETQRLPCEGLAGLPPVPSGQAPWTERAPLPVRLYGGVSAVTDSKVWLIGGHDPLTWESSSDVWVHDDATDTWSQGPSFPWPAELAAAAVIQGSVYVLEQYGGLWSLDPEQGTWIPLPSLPRSRTMYDAGFAADVDRFYVLGGYDYGMGSIPWVDSYSVVTGEWETQPDLPSPLLPSAVAATDQGVFLMGGENIQWFHKSDETWRLRDGEWTMQPPLPEPRAFGVGAACGEVPFVIGGDLSEGATTRVDAFEDGAWVEHPEFPGSASGTARGVHGSQSRIVLLTDAGDGQPTRTFELRCESQELPPLPTTDNGVALNLRAVRVEPGDTLEYGHEHDRMQLLARNDGGAPTPPVEVEFSTSFQVIGRSLLGPLLPGESAWVESPELNHDQYWSNVTAVIDPDDVVDESVETDNWRTWTGGPDFTLRTCDEAGPDLAGYTCARSASAWTDVRGASPWDLGDCAVQFELPFLFSYYGVPRTSVWISSAGRLTFSELTSCDAEPTDEMISPYGVYPYADRERQVWFSDAWVDGGPAFVVEWSVENVWGSWYPPTVFQAVLFETGEIEFRYAPGSGFADYAFAGIWGPQQLTGLQVARGQFSPEEGFTVRFTPPASENVANLAISVRSEPVDPVVGETVTPRARVTNHGEVTSPEVSATLSIDEKGVGSGWRVPALAPGEFYDFAGDPWIAQPGAHVVTGRVDVDDELEGEDESDNVRVQPFLVTIGGVPDLTVTEIGTLPDAPREGDDIVFYADVANTGSDSPSATADIMLRFRVLGEDFVEDVAVPPVPPGATVRVPVTTPWTAEFGLHSAFAWVDITGVVGESDESNNALTRDFTVHYAARGSNLHVRDAGLSASNVSLGQGVTMALNVTNEGPWTTPSVRVGFFATGGAAAQTPVGNTTLLSMQPGQTRRVVSPAWTATTGATALVARVDADALVTETDELDNEASLPVHVRAPDLAVTSLDHTPALAQTGDLVVLHANVTNGGDDPMAPTTLRFTRDGQAMAPVAVPALAPGQTVRVDSAPFVGVSGLQRVEAQADADGAAAESDESNNARTGLVLVAPRASLSADVAVLLVEPAPGTYSSNDVVAFSATIGNREAVPATSFDVTFALDGAPLGTTRVTALGPGETRIIESSPWAAVPGNHTLRVVADARGEVSEANETNNVVLHAAVPASPDLVIASLSLDVAAPDFGTTPKVVALVRNTGNATALASTLQLRYDGAAFAMVPVPQIPQGETVEVRSASFAPQPGDHVVDALVDADGDNDERVESNNAASLAFHTALRGLVVDAITFDPPMPSAGQTVGILAHVRNDGIDALPATQVGFTTDGAARGTVAVPALASGERATVRSANWTFPGGLHHVVARADAAGEVSEYNESNNELLGATDTRTNGCTTPYDGVSYSCYATPYSWSSILFDGTQLSVGDDTISTVNLPWGFTYYGVTYTKAYVSSNGFLSFNSANGASCCTDRHVPSTAAPNGIVAAYFADLLPDALSSILYSAKTVDGKSALVVEWYNVPHYQARTNRANFQIILFQDGAIRFVYNGAQGNCEPHGAGIENQAGAVGLTYFYSCGTIGQAAVEFVPNSLAPLPSEAVDLRADALTHTPADPSQDAPIALEGLLTNVGPGIARGFRTQLRLDGVTRLDHLVAAIRPGVQIPARLVIPAPGGAHAVTMSVDATAAIAEPSESNNARSDSFNARRPDLVVEEVWATPDPLRHGDVATFHARIRNVGAGDAYLGTVTRFQVSFTFNSLNVGTPPIPAGESVEVTYTGWIAGRGDYTLAATADATNVIAEPYEQNTLSTQIHVRVPDLIIESVTPAPAGPVHGDELSAIVRLGDLGDDTAGASLLRFTYDGVLIAEVEAPAIDPGATVDITIPLGVAVGGTHAVVATVDALGAVYESREWNNVASGPLRVRQADLEVSALVADLGVSGQTSTLIATIQNLGDADAAPTTTRVLIDGALLAELPTPALAAGASTDVTYAWSGAGGDATLSAIADVADALAEISETNNARSLAIHVRAPQLVAGALALDVAAPEHGDAVVASLGVDNTGDAEAPATVARLLVDGAIVGEAALPALAAGASSTVAFPWTAVGGDHVLVARIDATGVAVETREDDNDATLALHVLHVDLAALSLVATPASPAAGEATTLRVTLRNDGDADADAFVVRVRDGAATLHVAEVESLAAGATTTLDVAWTAVGGNRALVAEVDAFDALDESDETDNSAALVLHVREVDLVAARVALTDAAPADGAALGAIVSLRNDGDADAGAFVVGVTLDGATLWSANVPSLAAGASLALDVPIWAAEPGSHVVVAMIDAAGTISERNEANNVASAVYHVRQPDLVAGEITITQSIAPDNKDVTFRVQVRNDGNATAGAFRVRFVMEDGAVVGDVVVASLAAGASTEVSAPPVKLKLGLHTVTATVDWLEAVRERAEANNVASKTFTVTNPGAL